MLADPRAASLVTNFAQQWLDIRGIRDIVPDPVLFPEYNPDLGDAFAQRARAVPRRACCSRTAACSSCLNAEHTFLNERLALHYGVPSVRGDNFRRVDARRREPLGLVRQGRHPDGDVVPEPHGARAARRVDPRSDHGHAARVAAAERRGVPRDAGRRAADAPCASGSRCIARIRRCNGCHGVMDPLGFALENFDAIGAWRVKDREAGAAIDSSGQLADGTRRQRARRPA